VLLATLVGLRRRRAEPGVQGRGRGRDSGHDCGTSPGARNA
jgi:hypothetical protein